MSIKNDAKIILQSEEMNEETKEFLMNVTKAVLGDAEARAYVAKSIAKSPMFIPNILFFEKLQMFISGTFLNDDDKRKISEKLAENGDGAKSAERIIKCIDSLDFKEKTKYLINLTRGLLNDIITRQQYFRLVNVLQNIIDEDITFIKENLGKEPISDCESAQALDNLGVMYIAVMDETYQYAFSPMAYSFYNCAIRYDDDNIPKINPPKALPDRFFVESVSNEDISAMVDSLFNE